MRASTYPRKKPVATAKTNPLKISGLRSVKFLRVKFFSLTSMKKLSNKLMLTMIGRASAGEKKNAVKRGIANKAVPKPAMPFIMDEKSRMSPPSMMISGVINYACHALFEGGA